MDDITEIISSISLKYSFILKPTVPPLVDKLILFDSTKWHLFSEMFLDPEKVKALSFGQCPSKQESYLVKYIALSCLSANWKILVSRYTVALD